MDHAAGTMQRGDNGTALIVARAMIPAGSVQSEVADGFAKRQLGERDPDWDELDLAGRSQRKSCAWPPGRPVRSPEGSGIHEGMARGAVAVKRTTAIELETNDRTPHRLTVATKQ